MGELTPPGGLTSDNPFKSSAERSPFFWGGLANTYQIKLNKNRQGQLGASHSSQKSLITGGGSDKSGVKRKRIYGMGKTTGQKSSGTVKKPKLGGE